MKAFNFNTDLRVDIATSSGMLRVTIHPRSRWFILLLEMGVIFVFAKVIYGGWNTMSAFLKACFGCALVTGMLSIIYQLSGLEIIEIDSRKLVVCKQIHGWERKREYDVNDCSQLQWMEGAEDSPQRLQCKFGWRTIAFAENISENQAMNILIELQKTLPEVAQRLCSFPGSKPHFITLELK